MELDCRVSGPFTICSQQRGREQERGHEGGECCMSSLHERSVLTVCVIVV